MTTVTLAPVVGSITKTKPSTLLIEIEENYAITHASFLKLIIAHFQKIN